MNKTQFYQWREAFVAPHAFSPTNFRKPLVMGILNVTPDSFSDGGHYVHVSAACERAKAMIAEGVDVIDIGGESTKPGAQMVSCDEELARVIPVIEAIATVTDICMSVDTSKAPVMLAAVCAGAGLINDVRALMEPDALTTAARLNVPVCLMHMQGTPQTMQHQPYYQDVVEDVQAFFEQRIAACTAAGLSLQQLMLDPGFGFGKSVGHNLTLVKRVGEFNRHHLPLVLGVSRKSTIGHVLEKNVDERLAGGLALSAWAALQGVAIIRTHDVAETRQALDMLEAMFAASSDIT